MLRRQQTLNEALDHAIAIMTERGAGGLTVSEIAQRMGMRAPSLYKYFPSLHAVYDALFARGVAESSAQIHAAADQHPAGVGRIRAAARAIVRWAVANQALAQLLFWRPVPAFEPSPESFARSQDDLRALRAELHEAVRRKELSPHADSDEAVRLYTALVSGVISQHLANQPSASYESGDFTRLTDEVIDLFLSHYRL